MFYQIKYSPNCLDQNIIKLFNNCKYSISLCLENKIIEIKPNEKYNINLESEDSCEIILLRNYTKFILNKGIVMYFYSDL